MPRFYFETREDTRIIPDDEGLEYPDLDAAEWAATETARNFGRDLLAQDGAHEVVVELRDEHRQVVSTISVSVRTEKVRLAG
jgi:hypothetical protein